MQIPVQNGNKLEKTFSIKRALTFIISLIFVMGVALMLGFGYFLMSPATKLGENSVFMVKKGASLRSVAGELEKEGLITSEGLFLIWAKLTGHSRDLKSGEYELSPAMTPVEILRRLSRGIIMTHEVNVPEGFTRRQIAALLEDKGLVDEYKFIKITGDPRIAREFGIESPGLEGYLYPDTYLFGRDLSPRMIVNVMVRRFFEVIKPLEEPIRLSGFTMEEVVTLASIIEKETGTAHERPIIASVFLNRLKRGMKLQTDPTVIYGISDFDGDLKREHLREPTAYNTYVIRGLPPGPIASPGIDSIRAVLYPSKTEYLYFVSKNNGTHHFSKNYSEHQQAVNKYQLNKETD
jgi:UPF0755 protein